MIGFGVDEFARSHRCQTTAEQLPGTSASQQGSAISSGKVADLVVTVEKFVAILFEFLASAKSSWY